MNATRHPSLCMATCGYVLDGESLGATHFVYDGMAQYIDCEYLLPRFVIEQILPLHWPLRIPPFTSTIACTQR